MPYIINGELSEEDYFSQFEIEGVTIKVTKLYKAYYKWKLVMINMLISQTQRIEGEIIPPRGPITIRT